MGFEWDESKDRQNVARHGINFEDASTLLGRVGVTRRSDRGGEHRWTFTGERQGKLWTVIYTRRGDNTRIISTRRARKNEEREYHQEILRGD